MRGTEYVTYVTSSPSNLWTSTMGRAISEDLKHRIVLMYETDGLTMEVISERLRVSVGLILKVVHLH